MILSDLVQDQVLQNELHAALALREISDQESLALAVRSLERASVLGDGQLAEAQRITAVLASMAGDYGYAETLIVKARNYFATHHRIAAILCDLTKIEITLATSSTTNAEKELAQIERQIEMGVSGIPSLLAQIIILRCKLTRAMILQSKWMLPESIELLEAINQHADQFQLRNISTESLLLLGDAHVHSLNYSDANLAYSRALEQTRQCNLKIMESWSLLRAGDLAFRLGQYEDAVAHYNQLKELSVEHRIRRFREHCTLREARIYLLQQRLSEAEVLLSSILGSESYEIRIYSNIVLGRIAEQRAKYPDAINYFASAFTQALSSQRRDLIILAHRSTLSSVEVSQRISKHLQVSEDVHSQDLVRASELALSELFQSPLPETPRVLRTKSLSEEQSISQDLLQEQPGQEYLHDQFDAILAERYPALSVTERRVCRLIRAGLSSKQIASLLTISKRTVDAHREHIIQKLGIRGQSSLRLLLRSIQ